MKRVSEVFGIYPPHATALEQKGIRTVADLVQARDLASLSAETGITEDFLREWRAFAQQEPLRPDWATTDSGNPAGQV